MHKSLNGSFIKTLWAKKKYETSLLNHGEQFSWEIRMM